jgi:hypothetical protein
MQQQCSSALLTLRRPIVLFQNGTNLLLIASYLGLGALSTVVEETYSVPQFLPPSTLNSSLTEAGSGVMAQVFIQDEAKANHPTRPRVAVCQYGGSEHYFYRGYRALQAAASGVWFVVGTPPYSCRSGDGWEESTHIEKLLAQMEEDQPFVLTIVTKEDKSQFEELKAKTVSALDLDTLLPRHPKSKVIVCSLTDGKGIREAVEWLVTNARQFPEDDSSFCNIC